MKKYTIILSIIFCLGVGTTEAQFSEIFHFGSINSNTAYSSLTLAGNVMYGTSNRGGAQGYGCIFSVAADGSNYRDLHDFNFTTGANPDASGSITISGNVLYGTASGGGISNAGIVFAMNTDGSNFKVLHSFKSTDGKHPETDLLLIANTLYGTTSAGGANGMGNIYSLNVNGSNFKDVLDFNGANGANSYGDLIVADKKIYGMTASGGIKDGGVIFSIDINSNEYKTVYNFSGAGNIHPYGSLTLSGNVMYGMTSGTGNGKTSGSVFSIHTDGNEYKVLLAFDSLNGAAPYGSLLLSGRTLYGMTELGGTYNDGCIFSIDCNGTEYTNLHSFNGKDGANAFGNLVISGNTLYGIVPFGGTDQSGTIFEFTDSTLSANNIAKGK